MSNWMFILIILWAFIISYFATTAYIASFVVVRNTTEIKTLSTILDYMDQHGTQYHRDIGKR